MLVIFPSVPQVRTGNELRGRRSLGPFVRHYHSSARAALAIKKSGEPPPMLTFEEMLLNRRGALRVRIRELLNNDK